MTCVFVPVKEEKPFCNKYLCTSMFAWQVVNLDLWRFFVVTCTYLVGIWRCLSTHILYNWMLCWLRECPHTKCHLSCRRWKLPQTKKHLTVAFIYVIHDALSHCACSQENEKEKKKSARKRGSSVIVYLTLKAHCNRWNDSFAVMSCPPRVKGGRVLSDRGCVIVGISVVSARNAVQETTGSVLSAFTALET